MLISHQNQTGIHSGLPQNTLVCRQSKQGMAVIGRKPALTPCWVMTDPFVVLKEDFIILRYSYVSHWFSHLTLSEKINQCFQKRFSDFPWKLEKYYIRTSPCTKCGTCSTEGWRAVVGWEVCIWITFKVRLYWMALDFYRCCKVWKQV